MKQVLTATYAGYVVDGLRKDVGQSVSFGYADMSDYVAESQMGKTPEVR
jgi:hypothetical protein